MAHDDDKQADDADFWAELDAAELPGSLEDQPEQDGIQAAEGTVSDDAPVAESLAADAASAADSDIDAWLNEPGDESRPALSVFSDDEAAEISDGGDLLGGDQSAIEIGTGQSGVPSPSSLDIEGDPFAGSWDDANDTDDLAPAFNPFAEDGTEADDAFHGGEPNGSVVDPSGASEASLEGAFEGDKAEAFAVEAPSENVEPLAAVTETPPPAKKRTGIGGLIGIAAGGLLAVPITLAILLWGFGRDPLGLAGVVPEPLAFLVPAGLRPGGMPPPAPLATGPFEPAAPAAAEPAVPPESDPAASVADRGDEPSDTELAAEPSVDEPPMEPDPTEPADASDMADLAEPLSDPISDLPPIEPDSASLLATLEPAAEPAGREPEPTEATEAMESLAISPEPEPAPAPAPPPEPEPEPLDIAQLAAAADVAVAETEALVASASDQPARRVLAGWYRSLSDYAENLAAVEREAIDSGRSFEPATESVAAVHREIAAHPELHAHLARLTRDWIDYPRRTSDGIVVPAALVRTQPLGPLWRSVVVIGDTEGRPDRELIVVTRSQPTAAGGETVLVTGLAVDDGVIWATEIRSAVADAEGDPGP